MSRPLRIRTLAFCAAVLIALPLAGFIAPVPASAQIQFTGFRLAVAEAAARDDDLAAFYRDRDFDGIWTGSGPEMVERRNALLAALEAAPAHGLPARLYDADALIGALRAADTPSEQGRMEVALSRAFVRYARDINSGVLEPGAVVGAIKREAPLIDRRALLDGFVTTASPQGYLRDFAPRAPEYTRLMRQHLELRAALARGGWGPTVPGGALGPGDSGEAVIALRDRLMAMGHLDRSVTRSYDADLTAAVERAQAAFGLEVDGVAGPATIDAINTPMLDRLESVLVAMERERWMNFDRGARHVWVNLTDFSASIVDLDRVTFQTRAVIGATSASRETPEFSDVMTHMVINPSWYVPRSITVNEYLPSLRRNPGSVGHLQIIDRNGRVVSRNQDFSRYSSSSFPYSMRQPPGPRNALGQVKFMFPNQYNIYLHDTPARNLFSRAVRAFSHGCIRLNDPYDFAYTLLEPQEADPVGYFDSIRATRAETRVDLDTPIQVHLVYRTAFTDVTGVLRFRNDIYGRDAAIWSALEAAGVEVGRVQG